jgi:hypothetical protein
MHTFFTILRRGFGSALFLFWNGTWHNFALLGITPSFSAGSTPAAGIEKPRRTLYMAFCGAFFIVWWNRIDTNFETL